VLLSGVVVNNGIVLIDYTNRLRAEGRTPSSISAAEAASRSQPASPTRWPSAASSTNSASATPRVPCPHEGPRGSWRGTALLAANETACGSVALVARFFPFARFPREQPGVVHRDEGDTTDPPLVVSLPGRSSGFSEAPGRKALAALVPGHMMSPSVSAVSATCLYGGYQ
jgi:hypothetical protein